MKAKEPFVDGHFELAVDLSSQAISLNPKDLNLFADRTQANIKLHNFTEEAGELPRQLVDKALTDNVPSTSQTSGKTDVPLKDAEPVNNLSDPVETLPSSSKLKYRVFLPTGR